MESNNDFLFLKHFSKQSYKVLRKLQAQTCNKIKSQELLCDF